MNTPTIETDRLRLRIFQADDLEAYERAIFGDADVTRYLPSSQLTPIERTRKAIDKFRQQFIDHGFGFWAIDLKSSGELIGHCGLQYLDNTPEVEIGYAIGKNYWRQGLTTEAAQAALRYAFEALQLDRVVAIAVPVNIGSIGVMKSIGMKLEGSAHYYNLGVVKYSIERADFKSSNAFYRVTGDE
jgi:ribosomal-protein-alanine N-acetyltransferase